MTEDIDDSCLIHSVSVFTHIFLIVKKKLFLNIQRFLKSLGFHVFSDNRWHAAEYAVIQEKRTVPGKLQSAERREGQHMIQDRFNGIALIPLRPQEFLKIQGPHFIVLLISYADAFDLFVIDAQEGSGADDIKTLILLEGLQCGRNIRVILDFIKEKQCFARNQFKPRIDQRHVFDNLLSTVSIHCDLLVLRFKDKVDLDEVFVTIPGKLADRCCFSDLTRTFDDQGHVIRGFFPVCQKIVDLSPHVHEQTPPSALIIMVCEARRKMLSQKMREFWLEFHKK